AHIGASLTRRNSFFKEGEITLRRFWDAYGSAEYRLNASPSLEFPIAGERINTVFTADYLTGDFSREYMEETPIEYSNFIAAVNPNLLIFRDNIKVSLGATAVYATDPGTGEGDFFIYPRVNASYNIVKDNFIVYGGIEGELVQNTYSGLVAENTFVSPTLHIIPTDKQYSAYLGLKGKLSDNVNYHLKGAYSAENNKPLLRLNPVAEIANGEAYAYGNSFGLVYDDVETLSVSGTVDVDVLNNLSMRVNAEFFDYRTQTQPEAWNLPALKATLSAQYTFGEHWFGNTSVFFTGQRNDLLEGEGFMGSQIITADAYADVNTYMGYRFNNRLSAFLKLNNILNNEYSRWGAYPVQGFQALIGASYQFNL
ncbi:MAG: TonB-dependent receptor, partial [Sinomicrobium sp.]|nr:TonB-dependent receptor [Sinomicrobium sp.]